MRIASKEIYRSKKIYILPSSILPLASLFNPWRRIIKILYPISGNLAAKVNPLNPLLMTEKPPITFITKTQLPTSLAGSMMFDLQFLVPRISSDAINPSKCHVVNRRLLKQGKRQCLLALMHFESTCETRSAVKAALWDPLLNRNRNVL